MPDLPVLTSALESKAARAVPWTAACLIIAATLRAGLAQYEIDYEVTLLPWLVSKGWVLYRDIIDQHPPLLPALLSVGGGDPGLPLHALIAGQHLALLSLTYLLARRLLGAPAALLTLALTEVWSVAMDSMRLWYDSVLGLVYLLLLLVLTGQNAGDEEPARGDGRTRRLLYSPFVVGVLVSAALLVKQHALAVVLFVVAAVVWNRRTAWPRTLLGFFAGATLPLAVGVVTLVSAGALEQALYWTVTYNFTGNYAAASALLPGGGEWLKLTLFAAPAAVMLLLGGRSRLNGSTRTLLVGFMIAGALPAWPRYSGFHMQGAVPFACILAGAAFAVGYDLLRERRPRYRLDAYAALVAVGIFALAGMVEWVRASALALYLGAPAAPYSETISPLRAWVAKEGQGSPAFIYGLDPLLYRALEVEPPKPWAPQLPWILGVGGTEERLWAGVETARARVALAPAQAWDTAPAAGPGYGVPRLRRGYREAARFVVRYDRHSPPVYIVGLVRVDGPTH